MIDMLECAHREKRLIIDFEKSGPSWPAYAIYCPDCLLTDEFSQSGIAARASWLRLEREAA